MTDYEMIMIFLTILALLMAAARKTTDKCEPPRRSQLHGGS